MPLKVGVALIAMSVSFTMMFPIVYNLFSQVSNRMFTLISR